MRTETRTVRSGERVGDIDWGYNFRKHFDHYCTSDERRDEACKDSTERLRNIEAAIKGSRRLRVTTDGGWPRCGWGEVLDVGMYDGWPYWRPVPSVLSMGPLGSEWRCFSMLTGVEDA